MKASLFAFALLVMVFDADAQASDVGVGGPLPAWKRGELDIHHINTGRGEAQLLILPDGTSLLVDTSGKTEEKPPFSLPTRPDASRAPGEWVARYVQRVLPKPANRIDYVLLTHFHGDHMGAIVPESPRASNGAYRLSGITEIAEHLSIGKVIDRGWPNYDYPTTLSNPTVDNYRKFLDWQSANRGLAVEQFQPGRNDQLVLLRDPKDHPSFEIRNLAANGNVWTGVGTVTRSIFPPIERLAKDDYPIENKLSIAFRVSYGSFDYFTGGDLSSSDEETAFAPAPWKDIETAVARVCGPVEAMKANHHGSWDANSIAFLAALRPRVIVVGTRADGHPAINTWKRMTSQRVWSGPRDIFATNVSPATAATSYDIEKIAKSTQGHVVIRVEQGGASYRVFVLDDSNEEMRVKAVFGAYASN
ncbi:ComEC/Rec2 family competence protein [Steroidobacter cummioxidans]|uniref:ComEC/Rec2 family competence protein n=1 Tax=Steroidobacter cummioxidans TaxID=1803913 RepID=UPI000E31ABDB|nr:MBL fold metallo-hydrolase [Steroidobacter cummioxidans]